VKKKDTLNEVEEGMQDGIVMLNFNIISCLCVILIKAKKEGEDEGLLGICGGPSLHTLEYS